MKKHFMIVLSALLVLSFSACQATPTQAIVKEKNLDKMIEEATKTQPPQQTATVTAAAGTGEVNELMARMGAEKTYVKELEDAKGKVKIHVNAEVIVPDAGGITIQRVEQAKITQQQVDALLLRLMKGELFSGNDYKPSKSDIQNQILQLQAAMASAAETNEGGGAMMQSMDLEHLQKDLMTASDKPTKIPIDGKLGPMNKDLGEGEELFALSQPSEGEYRSFHACNFTGGGSLLDYSSEKSAFSKRNSYFTTREIIESALKQGRYSLMSEGELGAIQQISISKEDAKRQADDIMASIGLGDFACITAEKLYGGSFDRSADQSAYLNPRKCVWFFRYARSVNGLPATYTVYDCMKVEKDTQSAPWSYEDVAIGVDDSGVVYMDWTSPYKVTGIVTENANVLSFREVMSVFETMAPVVNAWDGLSDDNPNLTGVEITINRVQFGLTRVTEQNKRNSGLLVPCWDFFGTLTHVSEANGKTQRSDDGPIPLLTINAIDGSVINRSLGY